MISDSACSSSDDYDVSPTFLQSSQKKKRAPRPRATLASSTYLALFNNDSDLHSETEAGYESKIQAGLQEASTRKIVIPGDIVTVGTVIAGHGTYQNDKTKVIYAQVAGVVDQIDSVVCVKPQKQGYQPEIGDVVIGRVLKVDGQRCWVLDINSHQHAYLGVGAVNRQTGIQGRITQDDVVKMRKVFQEGDLISVEVQNINRFTAQIQVHTRSQISGKLENGFFLKVDNNLIRRMSSQKIQITCQEVMLKVGLIIGINGYIWIYPWRETLNMIAGQFAVSSFEREALATVRNSILLLERKNLPIFKETIDLVVQSFYAKQTQSQSTFSPKAMFSSVDICDELTASAREKIENDIKAQDKLTFLKARLNQLEQQMVDKYFD